MSSDYLSKDIVYVSSSNKLTGTSDNFSVDLTQQIKSNNNYDSAALLSFSCPKSYYLFNNTNNTFTLTENGISHQIVIPIGNYSFSTLATELTTLLNAYSWTYVVSQSTRLGKYTFTVSGNTSQPIFDFSGDSPYAIMGFEKQSYTFSANTLTSVNIVNFQLTSTIQLCCDFVENSVLSVIIPNSSDFSVINYNEQNPPFASHPVSKSNIRSANFYLLDGNTGKPLSLNGLNYNFTFAIYKKNDYFSHMIEDKKLELYMESLKNNSATL